MAYSVSLTEEAKKKMLKTKQKALTGGDVEEKSNRCYFCGVEVPEDFAELTRTSLGEVVCGRCITKLVKLMIRQGVRRLE